MGSSSLTMVEVSEKSDGWAQNSNPNACRSAAQNARVLAFVSVRLAARHAFMGVGPNAAERYDTLVASNCSCRMGPPCTLLFIMIKPVDAHQTITVPASSKLADGKQTPFMQGKFRLCFDDARMKNQDGHWVCRLMSLGRNKSLA